MKIPEPKKLPSGSWRIRLRIKGQDVSITRGSRAECIKAAQSAKLDFLTSEKIAVENITLKDAAEKYIEQAEGRLQASTIQGYKKIVNNQFPQLFNMPLKKINDKVIAEAVSEECKRKSARGKPYSAKTINSGWIFISDILKRENVSFSIPRLPEIQRKAVQILTAEEVYSAVKGTEIELPCLLAMWLGFTISEIRGFTKSKSISHGQLSVVETVVDIGGKPVRKKEAKEELRARTVKIPDYIMSLISNIEGDVICPLSSQAVNKRLGRLLEKAGLPHISFHKLRHIFASTGASLGVQNNVMQAKGGWKTEYTMTTVYTHVFSADRVEADEKFDNYFNNIIVENDHENDHEE